MKKYKKSSKNVKNTKKQLKHPKKRIKMNKNIKRKKNLKNFKKNTKNKCSWNAWWAVMMIIFQISSQAEKCFLLGQESTWIPQLTAITITSKVDTSYTLDSQYLSPGTTTSVGTEIWTPSNLKGSNKKWTDAHGWISNKGRNRVIKSRNGNRGGG